MKLRGLLAAVLVAGSAALIPGLRVSADPTAQFASTSPAVTSWLEMSRRFDAFNTLLVGLEEPERPLTADGLERLKRITDRLVGLKAVGVLAVSSLTNVESISEAEDGSLETELLLSVMPKDPAGLATLSSRITANAQVSGALISRDQRGYLIVLRADPRRDPGELARAIEKVVEEERGALVPAYFGAAFFTNAIARAVQARWWLVPIALLVLLLVLRRSAAVLIFAGAAVVTCLGLIRVSGVMPSMSSLTALLLVAVFAGVAFTREKRCWPLVAIAAACLSLMSIGFFAKTGAVLALGSGATGALVLLLRPKSSADAVVPSGSAWVGLCVAAITIICAGLVASRARFHSTPATIFSDGDEVGRSIGFFDRRFGGSEFVQVDVQGNLRDPAVAARLLRLTELLEPEFTDVRSAAQVLAFLNHGFGGVQRIPSSRESLGNLWFFLEGRSDVRSLVSEKRDEAMVVLRVTSKQAKPISELVAVVERAVEESKQTGATGAKLRLQALKAPSEAVEKALASASTTWAPVGEVNSRLHAWLSSPDSPYQPTEDQWLRIEAALADPERATKLTEAARSFSELDPGMADRLVESVLAREKDLRLNLRAMSLAEGFPEAMRSRAQGIFADLLDPQEGGGDAAKVRVSGLPVIAEQLEQDALQSIWRALGLVLGAGAVALLVLTRKPGQVLRAVVEAAVAVLLAFALVGAVGPGLDAGSAPVILLPALIAFLGASTRPTTTFLIGSAFASLTLLAVSSGPVFRLGVVITIALACSMVVSAASGRFGVPAKS
jgi:predicted RND superfamily exporter protein